VARETLRVKGYRDFVRACDRAGRETKREVRGTLKEVGEVVRRDAEQRFSGVDARSAAGYRVSVRVTGVFVVQRLRKTTGLRPDYGSLQMRRALIPALEQNRRLVEASLEHAIDRVADHFDEGGERL